jgi:hypothetical protein
MILGMSLPTFTLVHVLISLAGIAAGLVVMAQLLRNRTLGLANAIFLVTTIATSATGFLFPFKQIGPPHIVGVVSLVVLAIAVAALHVGKLAGAWRWIYVVAAVMALYFNVFVGVVQAFQKIAPLRLLAPTQSEPPFAVAQGAVLLAFLILGLIALRRFRPRTRLS